MTNSIDFAALKVQLEHHAQSARQIPSEPLFSIRPDVLRAIIAMAEDRDASVTERDALRRDVAMMPHTLALAYKIRKALGWNSYTSLDIMPEEIKRRTAELARLRALLDEAREVVKPFVACKREMDSEDESAHGGIMAITVRALSNENLRRASAFLAKLGEKP